MIIVSTPCSISARFASVSVAPVVVISSMTKQMVFGGIFFIAFRAWCIFRILSFFCLILLCLCVCRFHCSRLFSHEVLLSRIFLCISPSSVCMWSYPFLLFRSFVIGIVHIVYCIVCIASSSCISSYMYPFSMSDAILILFLWFSYFIAYSRFFIILLL